jgi:hypothetical protein
VSFCTEAPTPVHAGSPSVSSEISPFQTPPPGVSTFAVEETSNSLSSVNSYASDGELGCINHPSSSSKCRVRHSLLKELNLATVAGLASRKKMYERIRNQESALCKLRNKYKTKKLENSYL